MDLGRFDRRDGTDKAYVRRDVTSLAPKVAGDVLFQIDDRDYRARLAQSVANVEAA